MFASNMNDMAIPKNVVRIFEFDIFFACRHQKKRQKKQSFEFEQSEGIRNSEKRRDNEYN